MRARRPVALTTSPLVSVVIPHYNYGTYLATSLGSVLGQEGVDVEVIVVDDRSTDGSDDVARALVATDPRVTLVAHETNMRHIATYNDGLGRATGEYVVLLSADDALAPGALARAVAIMEADPAVGLVYGRVQDFDGDLPSVRAARTWWTVWDGEKWIGHLARRGRNLPVNPEVVMRRSVYEAAGGYDSALPHSADMFLWLRAAARARVARVNGPIQAYYRVHATNMHSTQFGGVLDDWREVRRTFDRFFEADAGLLREPEALARRSSASMAREMLLASSALAAGPGGHERRAALIAFAREADPAVTGTWSWRWARVAAGDGRGAGVVHAVEAFRWKVRSQLETRLGI